MKHKFYVIQDTAVFGFGDTPEAAVESAMEWVDQETAAELSADTILRVTGMRGSASGSWPAAKFMTQAGELTTRDLVLVDGDTANEMGIEDV